MYICAQSGEVSEPRQPAGYKRTYREKIYYDKFGREVGRGKEIATEVKVLPKYADK